MEKIRGCRKDKPLLEPKLGQIFKSDIVPWIEMHLKSWLKQFFNSVIVVTKGDRLLCCGLQGYLALGDYENRHF